MAVASISVRPKRGERCSNKEPCKELSRPIQTPVPFFIAVAVSPSNSTDNHVVSAKSPNLIRLNAVYLSGGSPGTRDGRSASGSLKSPASVVLSESLAEISPCDTRSLVQSMYHHAMHAFFAGTRPLACDYHPT
jgi:hypothetical protein